MAVSGQGKELRKRRVVEKDSMVGSLTGWWGRERRPLLLVG